MPIDSLRRLADVIRQGLRSALEKGVRPLLEGLFGDRFPKRHSEPSPIRKFPATPTPWPPPKSRIPGLPLVRRVP